MRSDQGPPRSRTFVGIGLLQVFITVVGLGRAKGLAILLSPSGFGIVSTIDQLVVTVVQLGTLGLPFAAVKYMAAAHSEGPEAFRRTAAGFARAVLGLGLISMAVVLAVAHVRPQWFGDEMAPYGVPLELALASVPAMMLNIVAVNTFAAARQPLWAAATTLAVAFAATVGAVLGYLADATAGLYVGVAIANLASLAATIAALKVRLGVDWLGSGSGRGKVARPPGLVATAASVYLTQAFAAAALLCVRYVVLSKLGPAPAGLFQASLSVALTMGGVLALISNLYLVPLLNRRSAPGEKLKAANDFAAAVTLLALVGSLPLMFAPKLLVSLLYTHAFTTAAEGLLLYLIWQTLAQLSYVYMQLLIGLDDIRWVAILAGVGYGSAAALAFVLVGPLGLVGASAALAGGMLVFTLVLWLRLWARHGMRIPRALLLRIGWTFLALGGAGLVFVRVQELTWLGSAVRAGFTLCCLALTGLMFWRHAGGDSAQGLKAMLGRIARRPG